MNEQTLQDELKTAQRKSAKPMLWVSMISMVMFFAGLTSAYVVSMKRGDWVTFNLPNAFYISTVLIIISSATLYFSEKLLKENKLKPSLSLLIITCLLGISFVIYQYEGFNELKATGLYFTGTKSTVSTSFLIGITLMHVLHLIGGIITLLVVTFNHAIKKYSPENTLGFELGATFWHFVDILWIYLFLFFYFIR